MISYRADKVVAGIRGWHWIDTDTGAWEGPASDWENHHRAQVIGRLEARGRLGTVVQAGGCQGMYPRLLSLHFDRVHTFEPDPLNHQALLLNVADRPNITVTLAALGHEPGRAGVVRASMDNTGMHRVSADAQHTVDVVTIDSLGIDPDLIWLDIEGGEHDALRGAVETIRRCMPLVVCENGSPCLGLMRSLGYREAGRSVADWVFEAD